MPLPLALLIPPLIAWGTRAAATYGLARLFSDEPVQELKRMLLAHIVDYAAQYAGLHLDPDDPISDASFSAAISERVGFPIRTLRDKASIEEDIEHAALALIEQRSGYHLTSLRDVDALKADVKRIGLQYLSDQVGIPLTGMDGDLTPAVIKQQLLDWAKAQLMTSIGEEAGLAVAELIQAGGLEAVAGDMNSKLAELGSLQAVTARQFALKVAEKMASKAVTDFGKTAMGLDKKNRRKAQNREAARRFRAKHGIRLLYVRLDDPWPGVSPVS